MPEMIFRCLRVNDLDEDYQVDCSSISGKRTYPVSDSNKHFVITMRQCLTLHFSGTQLVLISEVLLSENRFIDSR